MPSRNGSSLASPRIRATLSVSESVELGRALGEHRLGGVDPDREARRADDRGEAAGEVARAAGDVEHRVSRSESHQQPCDPRLLVHARPGEALDGARQRRAPVALVDPRHHRRGHQVLGRAGGLQVGGEQVEVAVLAGCGSAARAECSGAEQRDRAVDRAQAGPAPRGSPECWRELGQPGDLALALGARGVTFGKAGDQLLDPVSDLQREVGGGGPGERAHVLDGDLAAGQPVLSFALTHPSCPRAPRARASRLGSQQPSRRLPDSTLVSSAISSTWACSRDRHRGRGRRSPRRGCRRRGSGRPGIRA